MVFMLFFFDTAISSILAKQQGGTKKATANRYFFLFSILLWFGVILALSFIFCYAV